MFNFYSNYEDFPNNRRIRITLPDGTTIKSDDTQVDAVLSKALGRSVKFISQVPKEPQLEEYWPDIDALENRNIVTDENMPAGTFFDLANIHLISTSTLDALRRLYPEGRFEPRRFRPNVIVKTTGTGFVENDWIGKKIAIGGEVQLNITGPCPRCVMTTLPQGDLPKDTNILKTAVQHNNAHIGVYAEVIKGGTIKCDDAVTILE